MCTRKKIFIFFIWGYRISFQSHLFFLAYISMLFQPPTSRISFINKIILPSFSLRTCIPEAALPYQGNYLLTHTHENLNNVDTPFSIAGSLFDKMDATGIAICWSFSLHYEREHLHAPTWNNSTTWWSRMRRKMSGSTDTRKCEDKQWCWLVRNNTHAFLRFHSGSDVFTRSALQVTNQLEG